ncbi:hypothetical protein [Hymenobacter canadensis]|uniref:DUF3823 domain-containing protein n=1 Tax=Hymenobacter canadensis TaxID=2999067 RepID=A0ABY7LNC8_9BACT|nr:hypothetical protein [Hymenobacter canadensis]WBA41929.1 hypothetical protein O3303_19230 [Hymenobacter canadensis]
MRKHLSLLLLACSGLPAGALLLSCADEEACGYDNVPRYYSTQAVELAASSQRTGQVLAANEPVAAADLLLAVRLQKTYYGHQPSRRRHLLPAAYACPPMPAPGYLGTLQRLDSVVVRSRYAYDAQHPAGASLNDLLLETGTGQPLSARASRSTEPQLQLRVPPAAAGAQQFVVRYRFADGTVYTAQTTVLQLSR